MKRTRLALLCAAALAAVPAAASPDGAALVRSVGDSASELVLSALHFVGVPYRRGGDGDGGFDCSGFTRHVFERIGLDLPRRADEQAHAPQLLAISRAELQAGDLVFFNTLRRTFSHVGIYLGDGRFVHAPRPGAQVRIDDMAARYWTARFTGARRAVPGGAAPAVTAQLDP